MVYEINARYFTDENGTKVEKFMEIDPSLDDSFPSNFYATIDSVYRL